MTHKLRVLAGAATASLILAAVALAASSPAVVTGSATKVKDNSAVLEGTVNPNGSDTTYYFQWGLSSSYGVTAKPLSAGAGSKAKAVSQTASGLIPGTTYHYRLVASNRYGTATGQDRTFKTTGHPPPNATTGPATGVSTNGATVTGVINPNGQQTSWAFEYGLTTAYGSETFSGDVPAGSSGVEVSSAIQGLRPGTVFHYRLVASHNNAPPSYGADQTFMTYPSRRPTPRLRATASPRRTRHRPYTLTISGHLRGPARIPAAYACTGNVEVRFFDGARRAGSTFLAVQPSCLFSGSKVFRRRPGHGRHRGPVTLRLVVRFLGNHYLAPRRSRAGRVTLG